MAETKHKRLDVVQLSADAGRWAAGTVGTVVEVFPSSALVEISDEHGHSDDFLTLRHGALRPVDGDEQAPLEI